MASHNSIIQRIKDISGDDVTSITSYKDLINSAFNYVADIIPGTSELWQSSRAGVDSLTNASQHKIIKVLRKDNSESFYRECKEIPYDRYRQGQDASSIYYTAGNFKEPVYTIDETGAIVVSPGATAGDINIYAFEYYNSAEDLTGDSLTSLFDDTYSYFPDEALLLGILKASANILQARISMAAQDDEDQEVLNLIITQISTLDKLMQNEGERLNLPVTQVGAGNDVK